MHCGHLLLLLYPVDKRQHREDGGDNDAKAIFGDLQAVTRRHNFGAVVICRAGQRMLREDSQGGWVGIAVQTDEEVNTSWSLLQLS